MTIECGLKDLLPLEIEVVTVDGARDEFKSLLDQYHYLGFDRTVGVTHLHSEDNESQSIVDYPIFRITSGARPQMD